MKKRIFALLLCVVMLASMIPLMGASVSDNGGTGTVAVNPAAAAVSEDSKAVINAVGGDGAYQWQIYAGNDVWANIAGQTGAQLTVSYGMVCGLMDGGKAYVRCRVTNGENEAYSSPVEIVIAGYADEQNGGFALFARAARPVTADEQNGDIALSRPAAADEPVGTVVREAYVLGEPVIILPGAATPAPTATPAAEATPAPAEDTDETPAEDTDETPAEEPDPAPDAEAPAEDGTEAEPSPAPAEEAAASPAPVTEAAEENTAAPAQDAEAAPTAARSISAPALRLAPLRRFSPVDADEPVATDAPAATPNTYYITIEYVYGDEENAGKQAANPWTATLAAGSSYSATVVSPAIVGYAPDQGTFTVDVKNIARNETYKVYYYPSEVNYTVRHHKQNADNDNYTLAETVPMTGLTNAQVGAKLAKDYTGFYSLLYDDTVRIAADGSTVIDIKYDRRYYLLNFDLKGGYGVEPIYARYGAPVSVGTPTKAGYTFAGWDQELPATVPAGNYKFTAKWTAATAGFTVVFWYENADPETDGTYKYSVAGTFKPADVAPGTQVRSVDYKDQSFTGRDDAHFTYNADKVETVTVAGDGSTVLNVYYTRNSYTLTFLGAGTTLICTKVEHTHSSDTCCDKSHWFGCSGYGILGNCNADNCPVGYEHTHSNDCYGLTITAKYQADIHNNFPIKDGNDTIWWTVPSGCESFEYGHYLGSIDTMPGENITFTKHASESGAKIYYYVETINGATGDTFYGGKNYKQYKVIDLEYDNGTSLTYAEEFHPITGFTQGYSNPNLPVGGSVQMKQNNYLYYTRNSYNLEFYNYNTYVDGKGGSVQYEAPLGSYYFTPVYPAGLEPNAYEFGGWYTTAGCYAGSEANLSAMTMPASDLILYAKWAPKTHTVTTWLTDKLDEAVNVGDTGSNVQTVPHGSKAVAPAEPVRDPYKFIGWFYVDGNGTEKAFDFSMPVNRDLNLYAKWNADTLVKYTIKYQLEGGTTIAPDTTGSALAGTTKTFDAKAGDELNEGYRTGYYPQTNSHSMVMNIGGGNEFIFSYVAKEKVPYTVKYLENGTNIELAESKTVETTAAVVTETFVPIAGYRPDAYQKRLVLAAEGNEIIFWYVKDKVHAPVQVIHWTQNIAGDGYTEYQSSTDLNGVIGNDYSETQLTIPGFVYNANPEHQVDGYPAQASGTLTPAGLVLNLYYDRILYPYEFRFLEQGTDNKLAESVTSTARYQAQVTQDAKDIPGYTLASAESQSIIIDIEDGTTAVKNVKTFYYTEQTVDIKYEVVGPDGCGTLDNYQENQLKVTTGEVKGSAPTAAEGFKFVGWYKDEDCTQPVDADWVKDSKLTPDKTKNYGTAEKPVMGYEAATYYAKFEDDVAQLTIAKQGAKLDYDENQSFVFTVTGPNGYRERVVICGNGSVTIKNLKPGTYTVTEEGWSWRYTGNGPLNATISALVPGSVTFTNVRQTEESYSTNGWKWLGGDAYVNNPFN